MNASKPGKSTGSMSVQVSLDGSTPSEVFELSNAQIQRLNARVQGAGCGLIDEALLYEPGAAAWSEVVQKLCSRIQQGCPAERLGQTSKEGATSSWRDLQLILESLCVEASEAELTGAGTAVDRAQFLERLAGIAEHLDMASRGDRLIGAVAKDCSLLSCGISSAPELHWEPVKLFRRFPELQEALDASPPSSGGDGSALSSKLQEFASLAFQEENRLQQLGGKQAMVEPNELRDYCASLEHSMGAFLADIADFQAFYTQEVSLWTGPSSEPSIEGIGPTSTEILTKYNKLREVLEACTAVRTGFEQLNSSQSSGASDKEFLLEVMSKASTMRTELSSHAAAMQSLASNSVPYGMAATISL